MVGKKTALAETFPSEVRNPATVTDAQLNALAPDGFTPTNAMRALARARIIALPGATTAEVAKSINLNPNTVYTWHHKHPLYHIWEANVLMYMCRRAVPRVWQKILEQAEAGCKTSQKLIAQRFDKGMRKEPEKDRETSEEELASIAKRARRLGASCPTRQDVSGARQAQAAVAPDADADATPAGGESDFLYICTDPSQNTDGEKSPDTRSA